MAEPLKSPIVANLAQKKELFTPTQVREWKLRPRQALAIQIMLDNPFLSKGKILAMAGYARSTQIFPASVFGSPAVQAVMNEVGLTPKKATELVKARLYYRRYKTIDIPLHFSDVPIDPKTEKPKFETSDLSDGDILEIFNDVDIKVMKIEHRNEKRVIWLSMKNVATETDSLNKIVSFFGMEAPRKLDVKEDVHHTFSLSSLRKGMEEKGVEPFKGRIIEHE